MPYTAITRAAATAIATSGSGAPLTDVGETLLTLTNELQAMLGGRTDVTADRFTRWLNFSYIDLAASLDLDDLKSSMTIAVTAGQPFYLLPSEVMATRYAAVIDPVTYGPLGGRPMTKTDLSTYRRNSEISDEPREYFRERQILVLWPTPVADRTLTLDFWIRPDKLVVDDDSPILGYEWHEAILLNARKKAFAALLEFEKAMAADNDFIQLVRRKVDRAETEDTDKIVGSSVPRRGRNLIRSGRSRFMDGEDGLR